MSLMEQYQQHLSQNKKMKNNTKESYCSDIILFNAFLVKENNDTKNCTTSDISLFFKEYELTHLLRSSSRVTSSLRNFFKYLQSSSIRSDIPFIPQKSYKKNKPRKILHEVLEKHLKSPYSSEYTERDVAIISTLTNTGLRASEFITLKVNQLDLINFALVNVGETKRTINILDNSTIGHLRSYLEYREEIKGLNTDALFVNPHLRSQLTRGGLDFILKSWSEYHNIPLVSAKDFRHSYGNHLYENGYSLEYIQKTFGLENLKNAKIYEHPTL